MPRLFWNTREDGSASSAALCRIQILSTHARRTEVDNKCDAYYRRGALNVIQLKLSHLARGAIQWERPTGITVSTASVLVEVNHKH